MSRKMQAFEMQSVLAFRQGTQTISDFYFYYFLSKLNCTCLFCVCVCVRVCNQVLGFIWLVRLFEIPVGSHCDSCTCQARLVYDLHRANTLLRLCQVIPLLFLSAVLFLGCHWE